MFNFYTTATAPTLLPSDADTTIANSDDTFETIRMIGEQFELAIADAGDELELEDISLFARTMKLTWLRAANGASTEGMSPTARFNEWALDEHQMNLSIVLARGELGLPTDHLIEEQEHDDDWTDEEFEAVFGKYRK